MFKPLGRILRSEEIMNQLTEAIKSGELKVGDKLPTEKELCDIFEVSRASVREALAKLKSLGFIRLQHGYGAGAYVTMPGSKPIFDSFSSLVNLHNLPFSKLIQSRLIIEPEIARSVANSGAAIDLTNLEEIVQASKGAIDSSTQQSRRYNVQFHEELTNCLGNPIISYVVESLLKVYLDFLIETTSPLDEKSVVVQRITIHEHILDAIKDGDGNKAKKLVEIDIIDIYKKYIDIMPSLQDNNSDENLKEWLYQD